jgi:hypothetical protein
MAASKLLETVMREVDLYRALGLSIIPVAMGTKKPVIPWQPYQTQLPCDDEVHSWFDRGDANVGIVCGRVSGNLCVLDLDSRTLLDEEAVAEIADSTMRVRTSRGFHIYVRSLTPARIVHRRSYGLDLIGEGGYVLAPPSIHPDGTRYEFANGMRSILQVPDVNSIVEWLDKKYNYHDTCLEKPLADGRICEGERNIRLFRSATVDREQGFSVEAALERSLVLNKQSCEEPLSADEVRVLVHSAYKKPYHEKAAEKIIYEGSENLPTLTVRTLQELQEIYKKRLRVAEDIEVIDVELAAMLDRKTPGDPLWLWVVSPPGSTKSEITRALCHLPEAYQLSNFTSRTLISGKERKDGTIVRGIYPLVNGHVIVVSELSQILTKSRDERDAVFSQLRDLYDGYLVYGYGTIDEPVKVPCRIGLLAGVTPAVDMYGSVHAILGDRFLKIRPRFLPKEAGEQAIKNRNELEHIRAELASSTVAFFSQLETEPTPTLSEEQQKEILANAMFTAQLRTVVTSQQFRDMDTSEYQPEPEFPTRLGQQLSKLAQNLAIVRGHSEVTANDMTTVRRVAGDTCLPNRLRIVNALYNSVSPRTIKEVSEDTDLSYRKTWNTIESLVVIGGILNESHGEKQHNERYYELHAKFRQLMKDRNKAGL